MKTSPTGISILRRAHPHRATGRMELRLRLSRPVDLLSRTGDGSFLLLSIRSGSGSVPELLFWEIIELRSWRMAAKSLFLDGTGKVV